MKNKKWKQGISFVMAAVMMCGCAMQNNENVAENQTEDPIHVSHETVSVEEAKNAVSVIGERPLLFQVSSEGSQTGVTPCVDYYTVEHDLSNIDNLWQFYLQDGEKELLTQNGFYVCGDAGREFFEIYEQNRYGLIPNFVTVDSMMHTYHLYFSYLLKNVEKQTLTDSVLALSTRMLDDSIKQYEILKGSEWEDAAKRNVAFFTVGAKLLDDSVTVLDEVSDMTDYELNAINQAEGIQKSSISDYVEYEDYTQYKPRGYYEGNDRLEAYFKAMMWYGRIHFKQESDDMNRSAILMTKTLDEDEDAYRLWEAVYAVTSFFAGASDDNGVCEYAPIIKEVYGDIPIEDYIGNQDAYLELCTKLAQLKSPQINSIPIEDGKENTIPGFRFMGQRFTIDAVIMQKLIYSDVKENSLGEKRMLPDVLDVPAALGSDTALAILTQQGAADYKGYSENMDKLRDCFHNTDDTLWNASLYANWLNTLRPLLVRKGEGYPMFMQNEEWVKKNLECFAGSFTELKHDTILYSKQVMAEMGGGMEEEPDDRGYVEPEPLVYERFQRLADMTAQGLKEYGMLSDSDKENLALLSELAGKLMTISNKELQDEVLSDEEYDLIRTYGGNIEHFWYEAMKEEAGEEGVFTQEFPAALVVDIATDPNGAILEAATGDPSLIYVAVKVDGKVKLARGSVFSFYQFVQPMEQGRMTDTQWRVMMGIQSGKDSNYDSKVEHPDWTTSYRYVYEWE